MKINKELNITISVTQSHAYGWQGVPKVGERSQRLASPPKGWQGRRKVGKPWSVQHPRRATARGVAKVEWFKRLAWGKIAINHPAGGGIGSRVGKVVKVGKSEIQEIMSKRLKVGIGRWTLI